MVEQCLFLCTFCSVSWWGGEVCSNGHGGGEGACYTYIWSFSNISVLQSVVELCGSWVKMMVNTCGSEVRWLKIVRKCTATKTGEWITWKIWEIGEWATELAGTDCLWNDTEDENIIAFWKRVSDGWYILGMVLMIPEMLVQPWRKKQGITTNYFSEKCQVFVRKCEVCKYTKYFVSSSTQIMGSLLYLRFSKCSPHIRIEG